MQDAQPELKHMPEPMPSPMPVQEVPIWTPFRMFMAIAQNLARLAAIGRRASDRA